MSKSLSFLIDNVSLHCNNNLQLSNGYWTYNLSKNQIIIDDYFLETIKVDNINLIMSFADRHDLLVLQQKIDSLIIEKIKAFEVLIKFKIGNYSELSILFRASLYNTNIVLGTYSDITKIIQNSLSSFKKKDLLETIINVQSLFIKDNNQQILFTKSLEGFLELTDSNFGFIGEILYTKDQKIYIKTYSIISRHTNIEKSFISPFGLEFHDLKTLVGETITAKRIQIWNSLANNPLKNKLLYFKKENHSNFLCIPIFSRGKIISIIGLADRLSGDYNENLVELLNPFIYTISLIIESNRKDIIKDKMEKYLASNEETLKLFIRNTPAAVAVFNKNMNFIIASNRWLVDFNLLNQSIIDKSIFDVFENTPHYWQVAFQNCLKGENVNCDEDKIVLNNKVIWLKWALHPWFKPNNLIGGVVMFIEDITARKQTDLRMEKMIENLQRSNDDLERFAYICTHDLQEPLRSISNFISLIEKDSKKTLDDRSISYFNYIKNASLRMKNLISDVLIYSKCDIQSVNFQIADFNVIINETINVLSGLIKDTDAVIIVDRLPEIICNKTQITQLFQNLITNAIKFKKENVSPIIQISAKKNKLSWVITVSDNGIGIEKEYYSKIFETFQTLHSKSKYPGTGIGLSLCKKIMNYHHGEIWLESKYNVGSKFFLSFPIEPIQ